MLIHSQRFKCYKFGTFPYQFRTQLTIFESITDHGNEMEFLWVLLSILFYDLTDFYSSFNIRISFNDLSPILFSFDTKLMYNFLSFEHHSHEIWLKLWKTYLDIISISGYKLLMRYLPNCFRMATLGFYIFYSNSFILI